MFRDDRQHQKLGKLLIWLGISATVLVMRPVQGANAFDHHYSAWAKLLANYTADGYVDYEALKESPDELQQVLASFQSATLEGYHEWDRNQKIAFWLNAYNFAAIRLVVAHYPIQKKFGWRAVAYPDKSIQQIPRVWDRKAIVLLGKERSLNEIEHQILRKEFKEPRIHFALVCASKGCPRLRQEPYVGERLEAQLDDQVRTFLSDARKIRYEPAKDVLYLSPIFRWFEDDFDIAGGQIAFVKNYVARDRAERLSPKTSIRWLDYDWSLNEKRG